MLDEILDIVLDPDVDDEQVGPVVRERIGLDRMRAARAARQERLPRDHGHLAMLDASMSYLQQFAPNVLAAVRFAGGPGAGDLLEAITIWPACTPPVPARSPPMLRPGSSRPAGLAIWTPRPRTAMRRPTGTTGGCAC